jgi:hypothetical protein
VAGRVEPLDFLLFIKPGMKSSSSEYEKLIESSLSNIAVGGGGGAEMVGGADGTG